MRHSHEFDSPFCHGLHFVDINLNYFSESLFMEQLCPRSLTQMCMRLPASKDWYRSRKNMSSLCNLKCFKMTVWSYSIHFEILRHFIMIIMQNLSTHWTYGDILCDLLSIFGYIQSMMCLSIWWSLALSFQLCMGFFTACSFRIAMLNKYICIHCSVWISPESKLMRWFPLVACMIQFKTETDR